MAAGQDTPLWAWIVGGIAVGFVAVSAIVAGVLMVIRPFRKNVDIDAEAFVPLANTSRYRMHQDTPTFLGAWLEVALWLGYCAIGGVFIGIFRLVRRKR